MTQNELPDFSITMISKIETSIFFCKATLKLYKKLSVSDHEAVRWNLVD